MSNNYLDPAIVQRYIDRNLTPIKQGKVRDIYDCGHWLLIITWDRISALDYVLPTIIPDRGRILQSLSEFWFSRQSDIIPNHFLSDDTNVLPRQFRGEEFRGRCMLVRKLDMFPVECIVRGYLTGSGLESYRKTGEVCGIKLPSGLTEASKLPEPIFTPTTKAETGHDMNITFEQMVETLGDRQIAEYLRDRSIELYQDGADYALEKGIIIADTKFEFGQSPSGEICQGDESLTPDSSRFWPLEGYREGVVQPSYDKQPVRDWLRQNYHGEGEPPALPKWLVEKTRQSYIDIHDRLTGTHFSVH